jgi:ubiquinone/menaquinone biosynthesis C-methylase UbiE
MHDLHSRYGALSDERWFTLLAETAQPVWGVRRRLKRLWQRAWRLPSMPDAALQASFVGSAGEVALKEGFGFYRVVKQHANAAGRPIGADTRILDFGCGWGRGYRFFMKDVRPGNLVGIDVDPDIIAVCRETIPGGRFEVVAPHPPTPFADASFDVIYAYSVLSHLAEEAHVGWVNEFARLLSPGGLVLATTQKRSFIEYCNGLTEGDLKTPWHRLLFRSFRPLEAALDRYDRGEFVYSATGGGGVRDASFYGEAAVPEGYVDRRWPKELEKLAFDQETLAQALIVARRV